MHTVPRWPDGSWRPALPPGDVTLAGGARLRKVRNPTITRLMLANGRRPGEFATYLGPGDLRVMAELVGPARGGPGLWVSVSHPDRAPLPATVRKVRAAFFPPEGAVRETPPGDTQYAHLTPTVAHLWLPTAGASGDAETPQP